MPSKPTLISELAASKPGWNIHARVLSKSPVKKWNNSNGQGSFFSITLKDISSTIRATFFKQAVDQFYGQLDVGKVYSFSKGLVKMANQKFNTCQSHLEIIMDTNSEIVLLEETCAVEDTKPRVASAITPPPKPLALSSSSMVFHHTTNGDSGVIKQGDWRKPPERSPKPVNRPSTYLKQFSKNATGTPVSTPPPAEEHTHPHRDANLTDEERAKLRADRAAAAEARIKKQQYGVSKRKRTRDSDVPPLVSPHSSKRMRWSLG